MWQICHKSVRNQQFPPKMKNLMIFLFTYKARLYLAYIFIGLNIFQIVIGCAMTIGSLYICLAVTKHLYAEKAEIQFVFTVFALYGVHVILLYLVGIKIIQLCFVKAHKRSTKRNLNFWLILCGSTLIALFILATMIVRISKHIVRSIRHSMEKGMRHYLTDSLWKHTIDKWQFSLRCCGVNGYSDWYLVSWLTKYHVKSDSATVKNLLLSKDHLHLPIVPWSCCDINFPMQCFHDPLQQIDSAHIWKDQPNIPDMSVYKTGCLEVIRYPIELCLIAFLCMIVLMIIAQLIIIVVSRLLYTSCRNAVILHDCLGRAPGWLFTRDCLANKRGRTLSEMMFEMKASEDSEQSEEDDAEEEGEDEASSPEVAEDEIMEQKAAQPIMGARPLPMSRSPSPRSRELYSQPRISKLSAPYKPLGSYQKVRQKSASQRSTLRHNMPPRVPPRIESQPRGTEQLHLSSLATDPILRTRDYTRYSEPRRDQSMVDKYGRKMGKCKCRNSARNPVLSCTEDRLMMG